MVTSTNRVSICDTMLLLLLLIVMQRSLTSLNIKAMAFAAPYNIAVDPYSTFTCPQECACYKVNETSHRPTTWINCTVSHISTNLTTLIRQISNPLSGYVFFTCSREDVNRTQLPTESSLWEGAFQKMTSMKALGFDHCRFKSLSKNGFRGLGSLNELVIRNAVINDLDPDLLAYLPLLEVLEISSSSVTHLFPLCAAGLLRTLNITGNDITSVEHAGLHCSDEFIHKLETLDISSNALTEIPSWLSRNLPNLYHLRLANNHISQTEYSPFKNLPKLTFLDISNNSFSRLHHDFFKGCNNLHYLDMSMNAISTFPRGLLANLSMLQQLHINHVDLDDKVWTELPDQQQITLMNMSNNRLTSISIDSMSQFINLEYLYLSNNRIKSVQISAFEYHIKLKVLDLSFNEISEISSQVFMNQYELKSLYLHHNKLTKIELDAFSMLKELLFLDISQNRISSLPSKAFHGLTKLTHLDLSGNIFAVIDSEMFLRTAQISHLNISHNDLTDVIVLNQLLKLKTIDLSFNRISNLNPTFLLELRELNTINLSHNQLTSLPIKLFKGCDSLKVIDMSFNSIRSLDETTFSSTPRVQTINLTHNAISDIGNAFSGLKELEVLDLSFNSIDNVLRGQFPHFITHLNLRGNRIVLITAHTFKSLNRLRTVDLSDNKLTSLNQRDVEITFNMGQVPVFNLELNPFVCDCRLGWLKDWSMGTLKDAFPLPTFYLNSGLSCSSPFYSGMKTLQEVPRSEFLCSYISHCEESCMCCDYACYCKYVCPESCQCYIGDNHLNTHHVQCSSVNLTAVPLELPEGATDLRLDGNNIQVLHRHEFLALKHVENLYLNNSQITHIQNNTFKGMKSVKFLHLQDNYLTTIFSVTFQGLDSLEELYLQNNDIVSIDVQAFYFPPLLRVVNLQGNELSTLPLEEMMNFTNRSSTSRWKTKMYLSGNPWICDLTFACTFLSFIQTDSDVVADISYVECGFSGKTETLLKLHPGSSLLLELQPELCSLNQSSVGNMTWQNLEGSSSPKEIYALIAACVIVAFAVTLLIAAYANKHLLQVIIFTRFGFRIFQKAAPFEDSERPYDAFISYSNKDIDFVTQQLVPRLENGDKKFQLCVHYQDFPAGVCVAETIVRSVEASKRTILVVSDSFLDSDWCRFEFQTAHQQDVSERCNRVILVLMHDLDHEKLDTTLKVYIRTRKYLKYDDPWFWKKLMFAMPDVRQRKDYVPHRLPISREFDYLARERILLQQQQQQWQMCRQAHPSRVGSGCESGHCDMYEIPMLDSPSAHYRLANSICCSTHTNSAYHSSGCSDITLPCHNGSVNGSCCHYEEVGPGSTSAQSTPQKLMGTPPPVPLIPKEGFVPRQKLVTLRV